MKMLAPASLTSLACASALLFSGSLLAGGNCADLPSHAELTAALESSIAPTTDGTVTNGGFDLNMWASVVNRDGQVCVVAKSGADRGDQWPGSRVISAQKANTANAFSLPGLALATANLWEATQPGASLFGLQFSNPVDTAVAYGSSGHAGGQARQYGTASDPMVGEFIGGVNVFGGGLALYAPDGTLVGALGVSGDSSCADHNIAWRVRDALDLDSVPDGVGNPGDNINFIGIDPAGGFGHPTCGVSADENAVNDGVVAEHPLD